MSDPYGPPPGQYGQPAGGGPTSPDDTTWALVAHIGSLVASAFFGLAFVAPLIVMLAKSGSPFVRRHAVESLNFQISVLIYVLVGGVVAVVVAFVTVGLGLLVIVPVAIALGVAWLVVVILATVKASRGEDYRYPLTIRFVS